MIFNEHSEFADRHAFLSPSGYHWLNYTEEKLASRFVSYRAAKRGTDLHALAHEAIRLGIKLAKGNRALASYVNDALGYKMTCEQRLVYSPNCFGTADTISFRRNVLRIHDLKTGVVAGSFRQLEIYAAIFCLEYGYDPIEIDIELRIYQRENVLVENPHFETILEVMDTIVRFDQQVEEMKAADI